MKLILPDAVWDPGQVSGATFLYFHDQKVVLTLQPSVSSFLTGVDHFTFLPYLESRSPKWKDDFQKFHNLWYAHELRMRDTDRLLLPLKELCFRTILLSYDRGKNAWDASGDILESSSLAMDEISQMIDPMHAADELFAHIFFEKVLEVQHPNAGVEPLIQAGMQAARGQKAELRQRLDFDWAAVYAYCDELFGKYSLSDLLTRAYMFRVPILQQLDEFMLSNERLINFLASLPVSHDSSGSHPRAQNTMDVIAWEFFRQLLSPYLDPLNDSRVHTTRRMVQERKDEIDRLKNKCYALANDVSSETNMDRLVRTVSDQIKGRVLNELHDLLQIKKESFNAFVTDLFSDQKTWAALGAFLFSLIHGGEILTAGSAIAALSAFGAKAFKHAAAMKSKLRSSEYLLIYRMSRRS